MSKIGSAELIIAAHNRSQRGLAEAERGIKALAKNAKAMFQVFSSGFVVARVFGFVRDGIKEMADAADQAANLQMMGSSLILLGRAAREGGADMNDVVMMLRKLDENTAAALSGNKAMADAFKSLGLSATVLRGVAPERALEMLAKAYQSATTDATAFDALLNVTGASTTPKLLDMLRQLGTDGLDGLAVKFGTVSEAAVRAADELDDAWGKVLDGIKLDLAGLAMDALNFYAGVNPGDADSRANGTAAQDDINRRMKAQNDAARMEMEATRARKDAEHKIFMDAVIAYENGMDLLDKQGAAWEKYHAMTNAELDAKWDLLGAQAEEPGARSMQTLSGGDLNQFAQQQAFQASEDKRKLEHERKVEHFQNALLKIQEEMRQYAKTNAKLLEID